MTRTERGPLPPPQASARGSPPPIHLLAASLLASAIAFAGIADGAAFRAPATATCTYAVPPSSRARQSVSSYPPSSRSDRSVVAMSASSAYIPPGEDWGIIVVGNAVGAGAGGESDVAAEPPSSATASEREARYDRTIPRAGGVAATTVEARNVAAGGTDRAPSPPPPAAAGDAEGAAEAAASAADGARRAVREFGRTVENVLTTAGDAYGEASRRIREAWDAMERAAASLKAAAEGFARAVRIVSDDVRNVPRAVRDKLDETMRSIDETLRAMERSVASVGSAARIVAQDVRNVPRAARVKVDDARRSVRETMDAMRGFPRAVVGRSMRRYPGRPDGSGTADAAAAAAAAAVAAGGVTVVDGGLDLDDSDELRVPYGAMSYDTAADVEVSGMFRTSEESPRAAEMKVVELKEAALGVYCHTVSPTIQVYP